MEKVAKLLILACLFLSCEKEDETPKHCTNMAISSSLPIQFWVNGEETFNEKDVCGITPICWCQPINCDDDIKIAVPSESEVTLIIYKNDVLFQYKSFNETSTGIWETDLNFNNDFGVCDGQFKLIVSLSLGVDVEYDIDEFSGGIDWTIGGGSASVTLNSFETSSELTQSIIKAAGVYIIKWNINVSGSDGIFTIKYKKAGVLVSDFGFEGVNGGSNIGSKVITITDVADELMFQITNAQGDDVETLYTLNSISISSGDATDLFKSDCISVKESHPCTLLIEYSNSTGFDGIADASPNTVFKLRIPAVFFEEQNTTEQEDIELSNDEIVRLYDKVEEKRLLKIGFMPHYMHRKLLLALSYDFVTIDGKQWIRRDEYKKNEGNRHYPLRTAEVLLTDKNFIKENQL